MFVNHILLALYNADVLSVFLKGTFFQSGIVREG